MALLRVAFIVAVAVSAIVAGTAEATGVSPPNYVPQLELSYLDPLTGERISCGEGCRRFEAPAGVELEVRVSVRNTGGDPGGDGVSWDLWFDQRRHPFPGLDLSSCYDADQDRTDLDCWLALVERVDWDHWDALTADRVCVPSDQGACADVTLRVPMDAGFDGSRGRGVYSLAVWVDRFRVTTEENELDNFAGPVRVKVMPKAAAEPAVELAPEERSGSVQNLETRLDSGPTSPAAVVANSLPRPYSVRIIPEQAEIGFNLSSQRSRGTLEFAPRYTGQITVEVLQVGAYESMVVEVRKLSTGEILAEARGKGRIQLAGEIGAAHLKDDRRFEVVVRSDQGTRGARGTITVSFPARAMYRRTE